VNATWRPGDPDRGEAVNSGTGPLVGGASTVTVPLAVSKPPAFATVSVTVYVPGRLYVCCGSAWKEDVPSPNCHV
jgi:hypothetical protein